jgi:hypothetical protein
VTVHRFLRVAVWKRPPCITGASAATAAPLGVAVLLAVRGQLLTPFYGSNVEAETAWLSQITQI